jgi:hypothetical protein
MAQLADTTGAGLTPLVFSYGGIGGADVQEPRVEEPSGEEPYVEEPSYSR